MNKHADPKSMTGKSATTLRDMRMINLALQGGGAHGAFTWGVLDRLLDEPKLAFEGVVATSAGAMNAAVMAYGLAEGGRSGAQTALGGGRFFQPLGYGRLGQQTLVDNLFQRARKQVGGDIERLAGANLSLGDRLGADIRRPDGFAVDSRHGDITGFRRRFVADSRLVTGGNA